MLSLFGSIKSLILSLKASQHFSTNTLFIKGNASANDLGVRIVFYEPINRAGNYLGGISL